MQNRNRQPEANPCCREKMSVWTGFLFLLAAVGLHVLLFLLFCEPEPDQSMTRKNVQRSNYFISADHPEFSAVRDRIAMTPDPADFIRGGTATGYSLFFRDRKDGIRVDLPVAVLPALLAPETQDTDFPELPQQKRRSSDLFAYAGFLSSFLPEKNLSAAAEPHYPLWIDAAGNILKGVDENEENRTALFQSHDVTGPTELSVRFEEGFPAEVGIAGSSGSVILDIYAQNQLRDYLLEHSAGFDSSRNNHVRIFWQKNRTGKEQKK